MAPPRRSSRSADPRASPRASRPTGSGTRTPTGRASSRPTGRSVPGPVAGDGSAGSTRTAAVDADAAVGGRGGPGARLTGRAAVLFVVLGLLVVAYAWPVREYLRQRTELDAMRSNLSATQEHVQELSDAKAKWSDPAYVVAQARDRLHYVMPGEVGYIVIHPATKAAAPAPTPAVAPATPVDPWYSALWSSVQGADQPATR